MQLFLARIRRSNGAISRRRSSCCSSSSCCCSYFSISSLCSECERGGVLPVAELQYKLEKEARFVVTWRFEGAQVRLLSLSLCVCMCACVCARARVRVL